MNSLVVLFSVLALAVAKPSGTFVDGGALLAYTAPASAISHQSRVDIKSSPAIIATAAIAPITRTIIAEPTFAAAPVAIAAPSAVSHQSRIDIKSSPALIETYAPAPITYAAAIATPSIVKSDAIATIATSDIPAPGIPLDTPEVIAARAAHFEAKTLAGAHLIHKRSASFVTSPLLPSYSTGHLAFSAPIAHISPLAPITYSTPFITKTYSVHPW